MVNNASVSPLPDTGTQTSSAHTDTVVAIRIQLLSNFLHHRYGVKLFKNPGCLVHSLVSHLVSLTNLFVHQIFLKNIFYSWRQKCTVAVLKLRLSWYFLDCSNFSLIWWKFCVSSPRPFMRYFVFLLLSSERLWKGSKNKSTLPWVEISGICISF